MGFEPGIILSAVQSNATVLAAVLGLLTSAVVFSCLKQSTRLPPGPPGLPWLGNLFDIPSEREWVKYKEWSEQYGKPYVDCSRPFTEQYL